VAKTADQQTSQASRAQELAEIRAIAEGDEAAFARLIGREAPRLLRFAQGILGSADEAEDLVQEVVLKLWEAAAAWVPEARISTWLHRVTYNGAIDRLRRRRDFVDAEALDEIADPAPLADGAMERGERARSVRDAVDRLPHRQRSAVLLFHFQDLPQSEAARVMGVSESAFESLLARARRQMRHWLAAAGGDHD
jgi:RNA polymerase sigma-70 factor, ECF subfamily